MKTLFSKPTGFDRMELLHITGSIHGQNFSYLEKTHPNVPLVRYFGTQNQKPITQQTIKQ